MYRALTYYGILITVIVRFTCCKPVTSTTTVDAGTPSITVSKDFDTGSLDTLYEIEPGFMTGRPPTLETKKHNG